MIDLHCHILPGIDDGARTLDDALEMARLAARDGIEAVVATPHLFRGDAAEEDWEAIERASEELRQALRQNQIPIEILSGSEAHVSHRLLPEIRRHRERLVINRGSYLFIEFPSHHIFSGAKNLFFELMSEGINPIIAHPERNSVFIQNPVHLYDLIQMGALAQANSGSFFGLYGSPSREAALRFLEFNLIHFIASDSHDGRGLRPGLSEARRKAETVAGPEMAGALVNDNPRAVIHDEEPPCRPDPRNPGPKSMNISIPKLFGRKKPI